LVLAVLWWFITERTHSGEPVMNLGLTPIEWLPTLNRGWARRRGSKKRYTGASDSLLAVQAADGGGNKCINTTGGGPGWVGPRVNPRVNPPDGRLVVAGR